MYTLLVDSINRSGTFAITKNKQAVQHNVNILELPSKEELYREAHENFILLFTFGKYIVLYKLDLDIFYFFDYAMSVDMPILKLLLPFEITDFLLEEFYNIQYRLSRTYSVEDDIAILVRA